MAKKLAILLILLAFGGFFSGCTVAQRKEILEEAKAYAVEQAKIIANSAIEKANAKADEVEVKQLAALDQQLAAFKVSDPETGVETSKTWKDFDADKSGHLEPFELAKITSFVTTQTAKKVATGEIDKNTAGQTGKSTGTTLSVLLALYLARRGAGALTSKLKSTGGSPPGPGGATPVS